LKKKAVESRKLRRGKSAAKQVPSDKVKNKNIDDIFGFMAGKVKITGDIVSPIFSPEEWGNLYPSERLPRARRK
jgi:hypothetical protein